MPDKETKKKTNPGEQQKKFHEWIRQNYSWVDGDVKGMMLRAWFASIKANKE